MFKGCMALNNIRCLATDFSAGFCVSDWVNGVSPSGIFTKNKNATTWSTGNSGIPDGWTVIEE